MREETKISDCDLSLYLKRKLISYGITTIGELLENDINYLTRYRGLGKKSISEIIHFVNVNGFNFDN